MWFKIQNRTINFNTITNFLCDDDFFMISIEYVAGGSNCFSFITWREYYDTKTYLNDLASNHEKTKNCGLKPLKNGKLFPENDRRLISYN